MAIIDSLIGYWKMDEASGDATDTHGSNTLTDNATVTSAAGILNTSRQFTAANSEYFNHADNADLSVGDIDFTWAAWVYFDTLGQYRIFICKFRSPLTANSDFEYRVYYDVVANRLTFTVGNGTASAEVQANNLGAPSTGTWYYVIVWHDATGNTVNIQVNDGSVDSVGYSGGSFDTTGDLLIGNQNGGGTFMNGRIDEVGFWKRVLTGGERSALYNGGIGLNYPFANVYDEDGITFSVTYAW